MYKDCLIVDFLNILFCASHRNLSRLVVVPVSICVKMYIYKTIFWNKDYYYYFKFQDSSFKYKTHTDTTKNVNTYFIAPNFILLQFYCFTCRKLLVRCCTQAKINILNTQDFQFLFSLIKVRTLEILLLRLQLMCISS